MATFERCEQALRARLKTRQDAYEFLGLFSQSAVETSLTDDAAFINANIAWIMNWATKYGKLDTMGRKLGFPSDAEAERIRQVFAVRRFWISIAISVAALVASVYAVFFKD